MPRKESELFEILTEIFVEVLAVDPEKITPEASLEFDLGMDSLGKTEVLMALEERFDTEIPETELRSCVTVNDVVRMLMKEGL